MTTHAQPYLLLSELTILDFTRVVASPYLTRTWAELGAETIKIEACGVGSAVSKLCLEVLERPVLLDNGCFVSRQA